MNHLAHLYLSDPTPECRLGNLLADYLRPAELPGLPPAVRRGVMMHRRVDAYTDSHPVVYRSMARLPEHWGWFKGILIDVYYDRVLAMTWSEYSLRPLAEFLHQEAYPQLLQFLPVATEEGAEALQRMIREDRLSQYGDANGDAVRAALRRITRILEQRIPHRSQNLEDALPELLARHADLERDFAEFFPQLQQHVRTWSVLHPLEEFDPRATADIDPNPSGS